MDNEPYGIDRDDLSALIDLVASPESRGLLLELHCKAGEHRQDWIEPGFLDRAGGSAFVERLIKLGLVERGKSGCIRPTEHFRVRQSGATVVITMTGSRGASLELTYPRGA